MEGLPAPPFPARYRDVAPLGQGGMGVVYRAFDAQLRRTVALKVVTAGGSAQDQLARRFRREALALARVRHPNVVQVYEFGEAAGCSFLAMEYVEGSDLLELLDDGPVSPQRAVALTAAVADGLAAAHEAGVLHRDIKPSNVLLDAAGAPRLVDFGLARFLGPVDATTLTASGAMVGTLPYAPLEVLRGEPYVEGSDVYQLGLLLYVLLTTQAAYTLDELTGAALGTRPLRAPLASRLAPAVDGALDALVASAIAPDLADRPRSAAEFRDRLRAWLEACRAAPGGPGAPGAGRTTGAGVAAAVAVALTAAAAAWWLGPPSRPPRPAPTPALAPRAARSLALEELFREVGALGAAVPASTTLEALRALAAPDLDRTTRERLLGHLAPGSALRRAAEGLAAARRGEGPAAEAGLGEVLAALDARFGAGNDAATPADVEVAATLARWLADLRPEPGVLESCLRRAERVAASLPGASPGGGPADAVYALAAAARAGAVAASGDREALEDLWPGLELAVARPGQDAAAAADLRARRDKVAASWLSRAGRPPTTEPVVAEVERLGVSALAAREDALAEAARKEAFELGKPGHPGFGLGARFSTEVSGTIRAQRRALWLLSAAAAWPGASADVGAAYVRAACGVTERLASPRMVDVLARPRWGPGIQEGLLLRRALVVLEASAALCADGDALLRTFFPPACAWFRAAAYAEPALMEVGAQRLDVAARRSRLTAQLLRTRRWDMLGDEARTSAAASEALVEARPLLPRWPAGCGQALEHLVSRLVDRWRALDLAGREAEGSAEQAALLTGLPAGSAAPPEVRLARALALLHAAHGAVQGARRRGGDPVAACAPFASELLAVGRDPDLQECEDLSRGVPRLLRGEPAFGGGPAR